MQEDTAGGQARGTILERKEQGTYYKDKEEELKWNKGKEQNRDKRGKIK